VKINRLIKKHVNRLDDQIINYPVKTAIGIFLWITLVAICLSQKYYSEEFYKNVLVELHGLLIDLFVIGTIILCIDLKRAKSSERNRLVELIEDFSAWHSDESAIRVFGAYNRLRKLGEIYHLDRNYYLRNIISGKANFSSTNLSNADLSLCRLPDGDFRFSHLKWTIFAGADLWSADFRGANLHCANMRGCNLTDANFSGTIIDRVELDEFTILDRTNFTDALLTYLDLSSTSLDNIDLKGVSYHSVLFPKGFDPDKAGMTHVFDFNDYVHEPFKSLMINREQILKEPISLLDRLNLLNPNEE